MTSNQINYQKLLEERKHNRIVEAETKRANLASERLKTKDQHIQRKYNDAYFQHNANVLMETGRHNRAVESKDLMQLTQTLAETNRHNVATERLTQNRMQLDYNLGLKDLGLKEQTLDESIRHSKQMESMQSTMNQWNYELGSERNMISRESMENQFIIDSKRVAESQRANTQSSLLESKRLEEQKRHNLNTEQLTRTQNTIRGLESISTQTNNWYKSLTGR